MMIVLVDDDDGDDEDGVEYSHAIIIINHLGLLSLSLSLDELQSTNSNMSSLSNTKASSGALDPCHAERESLSLPSSTRARETSSEE